ncbi:MAG: CHAT domain-containing tetratricopeptide repeat protein [Bacteroidetes bacterium]|nr:CHAT domain-containing tetratricopeptide repeat protein [Bacteroidota bacterium]
MILWIMPAPVTFGQQKPQLPFREIKEKADVFFENQQYDSSIYYYQDFLTKNRFRFNDNIPETAETASTTISREIYLSCIRIAICLNLEKQYDKSLQILQKGILEHKRTGKRDNEIEALFSFQLANTYNLKGESKAAESWYKESLALSEGWNDLRVEIFQNLGGLYFFREDYERSIQSYQKALIICRGNQAKNAIRIADLLTNLGTAFSGKKEFQNGLHCFLQADSVLRNSNNNDRFRIAGLNINIGEILLSLERPKQALHRYQRASELSKSKNNAFRDMHILSEEGIAECFLRLGLVDSAMNHLQRVLLLVNDTNKQDRQAISRAYQQMGDILSSHKENEKALAYYDKAIASVSSSLAGPRSFNKDPDLNEPDLFALYRSLERRGKCLYQIAKENDHDTASLEQSYADFLSALNLCQSISKEMDQDDSRLLFHETSKSVLTGLLESGFLLRKKNGSLSDDLFSMVDANRNKILLDNLAENHALKVAGVPDSLMNILIDLRNEIVFYSRKLTRDKSSSLMNALSPGEEILEKVIDLKMRLDSLRQSLQVTYPDIERLMQKNKNVSISKVVGNLKKDEAVLEYFYADSVIFIFLAKSNGSCLKRVSLSSAFQADFKLLLSLLRSAGTQNFQTIGNRLYTGLIAPVRSQLNGIRHLIIIPDDELVLLPFEALISEKIPDENSQLLASWHFLIRDFEISYHFSAAAWVNSTERSLSIPSSTSFTGFAPVFSATKAKSGSYNTIPFAEKEVTGIADLFGKVNGRSTTCIGALATENNFREHTHESSVVHIATHSLIDEADPMNSALIFSPGSRLQDVRDMDDGFLHLDEIGNLQLNSSLVVLSACATGKGKVTKTEGVLALTRGFYIAGVSNILCSLWNIPDRLTGSFMLRFYKSFLSGKSYSNALRNTKLSMIANPATSLPYMWAGFELLGK